jgi:hypothetical protein
MSLVPASKEKARLGNKTACFIGVSKLDRVFKKMSVIKFVMECRHYIYDKTTRANLVISFY